MLWLAINESSNVVSPTQLQHLNTRNYTRFSIPLHGRSTSGSRVVGRNTPMKISTNIIGNQTRELSACSAVPQPTVCFKHYINPCVLLSVWWIISCSPSILELWQVLLSISVLEKVVDVAQKTRIGRSQNSGQLGSAWSQGHTSRTDENKYATDSIVWRSNERPLTALKFSTGNEFRRFSCCG